MENPELIEKLRYYFECEREAQDKRIKNQEKYRGRNPAFLDEIDRDAINDITKYENHIKDNLDEYIRFPPYHTKKHKDLLKKFYEKYDYSNYDNSIFIMTKFPEGNGKEDIELKNIIELVSKTVKECQYFPRIASEKPNYHPTLWDNVELYLIGCGRGIAIVQDKYRPEFNPNVAIEWGFMRGMSKEVLFLMEKSFDHIRADWEGFLREEFSWDTPENGIPQAIKGWLPHR